MIAGGWGAVAYERLPHTACNAGRGGGIYVN